MHNSHPDDAELIARCRAGDGSAWKPLVARYQRLVYAVARRAGLDEHAAADVLQTVFARLLESLPRIADPSRLQAWIVTTSKREAWLVSSRLRRSAMPIGAGGEDDASRALEDLPDEAPLPDVALDDLLQLHLLRLALERLDERCRRLLPMVFAEDGERPTYERIAVALDMPVGSIGPTRARCLSRLRVLLQELER